MRINAAKLSRKFPPPPSGSRYWSKCVRCGQCKDLVPLNKKHEELYNFYTAVTGFGFLQIDLSNDIT